MGLCHWWTRKIANFIVPARPGQPPSVCSQSKKLAVPRTRQTANPTTKEHQVCEACWLHGAAPSVTRSQPVTPAVPKVNVCSSSCADLPVDSRSCFLPAGATDQIHGHPLKPPAADL